MDYAFAEGQFDDVEDDLDGDAIADDADGSINSQCSSISIDSVLGQPRCYGKEEGTSELVHITDSHGYELRIFTDTILFSPPLYLQRYKRVKEILDETSGGSFRKVMDMGCAELKFFRYLQEIRGIQEIVLVDINESLLQGHSYCIQPLCTDYLILRSSPLRVTVASGDARQYCHLFENVDAVTMIELIEHMPETDLPALVDCVFARIRPCLVVVTTPNADFNQFIPGMEPGKFRHWDHRYEWTVEQFQLWGLNIVSDHPEYSVQFTGCGLGPQGIYCSQVAVFQKMRAFSPDVFACSEVRCNLEEAGRQAVEGEEIVLENGWKVVTCVDFPVDSRTQMQKDRDHTLGRFHTLRQFLKQMVRESDAMEQGGLNYVTDGFGKENERSHRLSTETGRNSDSDASSMSGDEVTMRLKVKQIKTTKVPQGEMEKTDTNVDLSVSDLEKTEDEVKPQLQFAAFLENLRGKTPTLKVVTVSNRGAIPWDTQPQEFFLLGEGEEAILTWKSLVEWVREDADNLVDLDVIRMVAEEECKEVGTQKGHWFGLFILEEDHWSSEEEVEEDYVDYGSSGDTFNLEDEEEWLPVEDHPFLNIPAEVVQNEQLGIPEWEVQEDDNIWADAEEDTPTLVFSIPSVHEADPLVAVISDDRNFEEQYYLLPPEGALARQESNDGTER